MGGDLITCKTLGDSFIGSDFYENIRKAQCTKLFENLTYIEGA